MTKEEYIKLLKSDYWKGYSYSLIKERNFTCEDCGRIFLNERNKLQVHHLVYRDVNPWSYNPEEVVVLCEECHKKRHHITTPTSPIGDASAYYTQQPLNKYQDTITPYISNKSDFQGPRTTIRKDNLRANSPDPFETNNRIKFRYLVAAFVTLLVILLNFNNISKDGVEISNNESLMQVIDVEPIAEESSTPIASKNNITKKPIHTPSNGIYEDSHDTHQNQEVSVVQKYSNIGSSSTIMSEELRIDENILLAPNRDESELSTLEMLERKQHADVVERAREVGVSTEGSTLDILERINHANVVERAREAGVSTEGSTLDILERINHANVVERAREVGVSTEGSTLDILERTNHVNVVERAREVGVSTEGSTLDILERINHANVVKRAREVGVSTEGSTLDILERITRKELEKYNN